MQLHLGGHLHYFDSQRRSRIEITVNAPQSIREICVNLGVPPGEVALAVVNGEIVEINEAFVKNDDRVELFSALGGG
jgi:sulfur carrier protein ThiS